MPLWSIYTTRFYKLHSPKKRFYKLPDSADEICTRSIDQKRYVLGLSQHYNYLMRYLMDNTTNMSDKLQSKSWPLPYDLCMLTSPPSKWGTYDIELVSKLLETSSGQHFGEYVSNLIWSRNIFDLQWVL